MPNSPGVRGLRPCRSIPVRVVTPDAGGSFYPTTLPAVDRGGNPGRVLFTILAGKPAWRIWRGGTTYAHWMFCVALTNAGR